LQRNGAQTGEPANAEVNRMPSAAKRSMLGVLMYGFPMCDSS